MPTVTKYNMSGAKVGEIQLNDAVFAVEVNEAVMHQAVVRQLSNERLGTHATKTRGLVRGGGRKPWKQKGTGRARVGSTRSPYGLVVVPYSVHNLVAITRQCLVKLDVLQLNLLLAIK